MPTIQEQISNACRNFTQQVIRIIGSSNLRELCAVAAPERVDTSTPAPRANGVTSPARRVQLREMGMLAVTCPVPGCEARGIRNKSNFCVEHANTLSEEIKVQLREDQKAAKSATANKSTPAEAPR